MTQDMERLEKVEGRSFNVIVRNRVIAVGERCWSCSEWIVLVIQNCINY